MTQSPNHPFRNSLGPAHSVAEGLYDNAVALVHLLDAWSKRNRCPELTPDAKDYITHNILNAGENLILLRQALVAAVEGAPAQWHPNADSAAAAANANSPTPTAPQPAAPSGTNGTNGDNTCPPTAAPSAATIT